MYTPATHPLARKAIEDRLHSAKRAHLGVFTARLALRLTPLLATHRKHSEAFGYWEKSKRASHLISIFCAQALSYLRIAPHPGALFKKYDAANAAANADAYAYAAAADADAADAAAAAYAAYVAAYAAYVAAAYVAADAAAADAAADAADAATDKNKFWQTFHAELDLLPQLSLSQPLWWNHQVPTSWIDYEKNLQGDLIALGLPILYDDYQRWKKGDFSSERLMRYLDISQEMRTQSAQQIQNYLAEDSEHLARSLEARLIVLGDGEVGKTSFIKVLRGLDYNADEKATEGVIIDRQHVPINIEGKEESVLVHYWDFGGQIHLHPTHQFFLRSRCVYVVMVKARTASDRDEFIEYWLEHIRVYGDSAPTIIVQTQVDLLPVEVGMNAEIPFDRSRIVSAYPFVKGFFNFSAPQKLGLEKIQSIINTLVGQSFVILHKKEIALKESIYTHQKNHNTITRQEYQTIARDCQIDQEENLLNYFDQLGIALHFPQIDDDFFVINPNWLTKIIYRILWKNSAQGWSGVISAEKIKLMITNDQSSPEEATIDPDKLPTLLKIMEQIGLLYHLHGANYLAPMLTSAENQSEFNSSAKEAVLSEKIISNKFLPAAIFYRLVTICGQEREIPNAQDVWRTGFYAQKFASLAKVEYLGHERAIQINIYGDRQQGAQYLTLLRHRFYEIIGKAYQTVDFDIRTSAPPDYENIIVEKALRDLCDGIPTAANIHKRIDPAEFIRIWSGQPTINQPSLALEFENTLLRQKVSFQSEMLAQAKEHGLQILTLQKDHFELLAQLKTNQWIPPTINVITNATQQLTNQININIKREANALQNALENLSALFPNNNDKDSFENLINLLNRKIEQTKKIEGEDEVSQSQKKSLWKDIETFGEKALTIAKGVTQGAHQVHGMAEAVDGAVNALKSLGTILGAG